MSKTRINERLVREAPQSTTSLLKLLFEGLDWPRPSNLDIQDIPLLPWTPDELHLNANEVASLTKIQQLPPLTATQPFGVFILSFDGGRLPVGAVRRVVNQLVRKQRARRQTAKSLWNLNDLIFFCQSSNGVGTLHVVAFRDTKSVPVLKVISWDTNANQNRLELIATQNLPALFWPNGDSLDQEAWRENWAGAFTSGYREGVRSAAALASRMAEVAKSVRDEVQALYEVESDDGPLRQLFDEVKKSLRSDLTPQSFADMYAQTMVYGLLTARITHPEDFAADALDSVLKFENPFLDAMYSSFRRKGDQAFDVDEFGLHDLAEILARTNMDQVLADFGSEDRKDDPVVFFYEEFLDQYDRDQKKELGTYYTPIPVVRFMVRAVDDIIKQEFKLPLGVADQTTWGDYSKQHSIPIPEGLTADDKVIRMIDPATGTGTFLLEWMRQAEANLKAAGKYSPDAMKAVVEQMDAFEISLSSYAVAHLKTSLELDPEIRSGTQIGIRLTDTLAGRAPDQLGLFGDDPIALEGQLADQVKFEHRHSVVIGNPPYDRVDKESAGGWIAHPPGGRRSLFDDILDPAKQSTSFAHQASLYNLYVYFWRWSIWKVFEQDPVSPGFVGFITPSSWLNGPGFIGLRELVKDKCTDVFIVDLHGSSLRRIGDENIFGIDTAVAVALVVRSPFKPVAQTSIRYLSVTGTKTEKFDRLGELNLGNTRWKADPSLPKAHFVPATGSQEWLTFPTVTDLFPWQQPGCKFGRLWPQAPSPFILMQRWAAFTAIATKELRAKAFVTGSSGRNIETRVQGFGPLVELKPGDVSEPIDRYGYRSFDRQWAFNDPRLAKTESPSLWNSLSADQIFGVTLSSYPITSGPAMVVFTCVPDMAAFRGSFGGKDVLPLYRDKSLSPNVSKEFLSVLHVLLSRTEEISPELFFSYCFALLAGTDYTRRFREELETPGPRIPLTRDHQLFMEMAAYGEQLVWLQTFGERFRTGERKGLKIDSMIKWNKKPSRIPADTRDFRYDPDSQTLHVADGQLSGVGPEVWGFEVSGMPVVKKWLGYRTAKGTGKAASSTSPLDKIRPTEWEPEWSEELREIVHVLTETEKMRPAGIALLDRIMAGDLISADELPSPPEELRKPPRSSEGGDLLADEES